MSDVSPSRKRRTWERRLDEAKKKHRPKLKDWCKDGFYDARRSDFEYLRDENRARNDIINITRPRLPRRSNDGLAQTIDRISCKFMSPAQFFECYEEPAVPCIISDIPRAENWTATEKWDLKKILRLHESDYVDMSLGDRYFKVGEDDDGYKVKVRFRYFLKYLKENKDDSPLYVFDSNYDNDKVSKVLLEEYKVPSYFPEDLFSLVGEKRRPPYRWFLVGPQRSGTCLHIDPLGTSAWNTVIDGRKRWVLFPPGTAKAVAKGLDVIRKGEDDEAVNYFVDLLPRIREKHGHELKIIEFTQYPGDTVFVPGGWWHAVLNLDDTIAITQNFCSSRNFDRVWVRTRGGRKKMAVKWLRMLREQYPTLAERAEQLNTEDGFEMYDKEKDDHKKKNKKKDKKKKEQKSGDQSNRGNCGFVKDDANDDDDDSPSSSNSNTTNTKRKRDDQQDDKGASSCSDSQKHHKHKKL
jgi:histone arginine demethylase JMJD6